MPAGATEKPEEHQESPEAYEDPGVSSQGPAATIDETVEETFEETATTDGPEASQEPSGEAAESADSFDGDS